MYVVKSPLSDADLKTVADALQGALAGLADLAPVAERASARGVPPDGRAVTVASGSGIGTAPAGWVKDADAVGTLADALGAVITRMRSREASLDVPGGERVAVAGAVRRLLHR
ncbi:hypothetical protein ACFV2H_46385 [Streptomyces sp. NPDC059629]|uniref:hypothetical protein n=1 Tax=Streptomyces sp. NPDC059629 TaxID=3346889 RepID=UPI0036B92696